MVISIVLVAEGTGFETRYLRCKRCFDKEEFDTDRSQGFLKSFNRILCTVIFKTQGVCVREEWPFKHYITGNMVCYERSFFTFSIHS